MVIEICMLLYLYMIIMIESIVLNDLSVCDLIRNNFREVIHMFNKTR